MCNNENDPFVILDDWHKTGPITPKIELPSDVIRIQFTSSKLVYRLVVNGETSEVEFETGKEEEDSRITEEANRIRAAIKDGNIYGKSIDENNIDHLIVAAWWNGWMESGYSERLLAKQKSEVE